MEDPPLAIRFPLLKQMPVIQDGLLHRSITINIQGESYRPREHRQAGFTPVNQRKEVPTGKTNP